MKPENAELKLLSEAEVNALINKAHQKPQIDKAVNKKPNYLKTLRYIGDFCYVMGVLSAVALILLLFLFAMSFLTGFRGESLWLWVVLALGVTVQMFAFYGILNALADIAENMAEVGNYVRKLKTDNADKLVK